MTQKTFNTAGTSTLNGITKIRFANDYVSRFKILTKNGHQDVNILELDSAMSKADVCKFLSTHEKFQDEASQSAIAEFVVRNVKAVTEPALNDLVKEEAEADLTVEAETVEA